MFESHTDALVLRAVVMQMVLHMCNARLNSSWELGAPRQSPSDAAIDIEMDAVENWRTGGGFLCTQSADGPRADNTAMNASSLSAIAYYVHYGVSPVPPYAPNANTFHHRGDFSDPMWNSTGHALTALERFSLSRASSPIIVVLSSLMWDIGRVKLLDARFAMLNNLSVWEHEAGPWLDGYEANLTAFATGVMRALQRHDRNARLLVRQRGGVRATSASAAGAPAEERTGRHSTSALLLQADYSCGGAMTHVCKLIAPRAAERVRMVAARLGLPLVDVHTMGNYDREVELIKREYKYTMHPSRLGACVVWNVIAHVEPRVPADDGPDGECAQRVHNASNGRRSLVKLLSIYRERSDRNTSFNITSRVEPS